MNIREGMGIKTLQGAKGMITKVEMQSHHGTVYRGDSKHEAVIARLVAEYKYYGQDAPQRHLFKKYGITQDFVKQYPERICYYRNNTSGVTGVSQLADGRWIAYINNNRKRTVLYRGNNKEEAIKLRLLN